MAGRGASAPAFARSTASFRQVEAAGRDRRRSTHTFARALSTTPRPAPADDPSSRFEGARTQMRKGRAVFSMTCLKEVELFKGCTPRFLEVLTEHAHSEIFTDGQIIFHQGTYGDKMYVLNYGEVEVAINDVPVVTLPAGSVFGEMAAMCKNRAVAKRSATVRAKGICDCRSISREAVMHASANFPADARIIEVESHRRMGELRARHLLPEQKRDFVAQTMVEEPERVPTMKAWLQESRRATREFRRSKIPTISGDELCGDERCPSSAESVPSEKMAPTPERARRNKLPACVGDDLCGDDRCPSSAESVLCEKMTLPLPGRAHAIRCADVLTPSDLDARSTIAAESPECRSCDELVAISPRCPAEPPRSASALQRRRAARADACRRTAEHASSLAERAARRVACSPTPRAAGPRPVADRAFLRHTKAFNQRLLSSRRPGAEVDLGAQRLARLAGQKPRHE